MDDSGAMDGSSEESSIESAPAPSGSRGVWEGSRRSFILSRPMEEPSREVIAAGAAVGVHITANHVAQARHSARSKAGANGQSAPHRGPGRPRKNPDEPPKRGPGRPRKERPSPATPAASPMAPAAPPQRTPEPSGHAGSNGAQEGKTILDLVAAEGEREVERLLVATILRVGIDRSRKILSAAEKRLMEI